MTTLHILSRLLDDTTLQSLEHCLNTGDGILLSCDATYLALKPAFLDRHGQEFFALTPDVLARGLADDWPARIAQVDHGGFVELCLRFDKSLSWA